MRSVWLLALSLTAVSSGGFAAEHLCGSFCLSGVNNIRFHTPGEFPQGRVNCNQAWKVVPTNAATDAALQDAAKTATKTGGKPICFVGTRVGLAVATGSGGEFSPGGTASQRGFIAYDVD
jgi:hypothetical protein